MTPAPPPIHATPSGISTTATLQVLLVDDHPRIREPLAVFLRRQGLRVETAANIGGMLLHLTSHRFDVVVLDIMLPDGDGSTMCARLHADHDLPVILLTARSDIDDRIHGLEAGAADYVVKPFDPRELLARIRSVVRQRRQAKQPGDSPATPVATQPVRPRLYTAERLYRFAGWHFDAVHASLTPPDCPPTQLSDTEARLLEVLLSHANTILSRDDLLDLTRTQGRNGDSAYDRTIDRQISRLRRKFSRHGQAPSLLRTLRGSGYSLVAQVEQSHE